CYASALVKWDAGDECVFFSSRRRHTTLVSDGSSDVCSSDLQAAGTGPGRHRAAEQAGRKVEAGGPDRHRAKGGRAARRQAKAGKIGRASCRERVENSAVGGSFKEKRGVIDDE